MKISTGNRRARKAARRRIHDEGLAYHQSRTFRSGKLRRLDNSGFIRRQAKRSQVTIQTLRASPGWLDTLIDFDRPSGTSLRVPFISPTDRIEMRPWTGGSKAFDSDRYRK